MSNGEWEKLFEKKVPNLISSEPPPEWQQNVLAAINAPKKSLWRKSRSFVVGFFWFLWDVSWFIRAMAKALADDMLVVLRIRKRAGGKTAWRWKDLP